MSYIMVSNWSTQEWTSEMEEIGRSKFIPMIMSVGATAVQMVRTGENNLSVISHFTNSEAAAEAKEKIAAIRSQAATELPMTMLDAKEGEVLHAVKVSKSPEFRINKMNVQLKQRTFNFGLSVPVDSAEKVEAAISDHASWMRETHSYDDSQIQLVHYYVSKAHELVNIADPSQGTTGRILYSINEVYVMAEGIDQHMAAGQSWKNFQSFVSTITEFGSVLIANGEVIETL